MKAVVLKEQGGVKNLEIVQIPIPSIKDDEVLVQVKAISINPADTYVRKDKSIDWIFNGETQKILGWDISGTIINVGTAISKFKIGDDVFGSINHPGHGKAYAEYVSAPAKDIALKPKNITHEEAAAATLAALTAWQPLSKAGIKFGDRIFITAAGGGVGHYAIQIAKYLGAYAIALSSASKRDFVLELGADEHIDYQTQKFEDIIGKVDLVLDALRDDHIIRSLNVVKRGGKLISLWSHVKGTKWEEIAKEKGIDAYYNAVHSDGSDMKIIAELLEKGIIRSHIGKIFRLEEIREAHLEMEKNNAKGKIVISLE